MSFDSQELYNLQKLSDAVGGYFSPVGQPIQDVYNPQPTQAPTADPNAAKSAALEGKGRDWINRTYGNLAPKQQGDASRAYYDNLMYNPEAARLIGEELEAAAKRNESYNGSRLGTMISRLTADGKWKDTWGY